jgi:acyl-CoA thioester hydrolase
MDNYKFCLDFEVRDYECDIQGLVNNSVYLNYLEHTRHKFLQSMGIDFAEFAKNKINLVVVRTEIDYKSSLSSGDLFFVGINFKRISPLRFEFLQDIFLKESEKLVVSARVIGTATNENGRPLKNQEVLDKLL